MPSNGKSRKIVLTGGGTAGHVIPHLALLPELRSRGWKPIYIGSKGMEKPLVMEAGVIYFEILTGKLRRYFSWQNLLDFFRVAVGVLQSVVILLIQRPALVFSKGGYVSVPVCIAARMLSIPVITHESDLTPGLATKIIMRFASKILYSFPETGSYLPAEAKHVGTPIRPNLFSGNREKGLKFAGFEPTHDSAPVILVMGGSLGAQRINDSLLQILPELVERFRIIHITGKGKGINFSHRNYRAFDFVGEQLPDLFAATDLVISRAGANAIFEFLALNKPMLLIPLEIGSRGDQVHNAQSFEAQGWAIVLRETELAPTTMISGIARLEKEADQLRRKQREAPGQAAIELILSEFEASLASKVKTS